MSNTNEVMSDIILKKSENYFFTVHLNHTTSDRSLEDKMNELKLSKEKIVSSKVYFDSEFKLKSNCDLISDFVIEDALAQLKDAYLYFNDTRLSKFEYNTSNRHWTLKNFTTQPFLNYLCPYGSLKIYWIDTLDNRNDIFVFPINACSPDIKAYCSAYTITDEYLKTSLTDKCRNVKTEVSAANDETFRSNTHDENKNLWYVGGTCKN